MLDVRGSIECAGCGRPFEPARRWSRYCSSACRIAAFRAAKCVTQAGPVSSPALEPVTHFATESGQVAEHSGDIAPLRYRAALGDKDIRDIKGLAAGTEIDMPDLPACLDRRVFSEAAEMRKVAA